MARAHKFDPSILREYDIRGIVGKTLDDVDARALGRAFGTLVVRDGGKSVAIGYDGRESSPRLQAALIEGLVSTGLAVHRIGLGPTPMLYFAVHELGADGGIMVTGSHNPPDYNGFKMMLGTKPVYGEMIKALGDCAASADYEIGPGCVSDEPVFDAYIARLLQDYEAGPVNVAWDPGNGAAGEAVEVLTAQLPGRHVVINGTIDGTFPNHHPDPTVEENLAQLKDVVKGEGLDIGIAFDGDGDRIGVIDGQGRVLWGDQLLLVLAKHLLKSLPGATIIGDVKASQVLFDEIKAVGGNPIMWKSGHSLIKIKMAETGAPLAGEMSGHVFFKHRFYGHDDALYAALRFLNAVAESDKDLATLLDEMPSLVNTPELRFSCPEERKFKVIDEVRDRLASSGATVIDVDGVRVVTEDGWWLLRASNTQDALVARVEANSEKALQKLKGHLRDQVAESGVVPPANL